MKFINFIKETSERSDADNWAKKLIISKSGFYFDSIEGCNQNSDNQVTHLIERAKIDILNTDNHTTDYIKNEIVKLETELELIQKVNFANLFGINLSYVLYCNNPQVVFLYEFSKNLDLKFICQYDSFKLFSAWIKSIKGWVSTSAFQHSAELPFFDIELRRHGTAWPTNIDCFISFSNHLPSAILEFQNAHKTPLVSHCNNNYFWGLTSKDDQRRWFSQEILRVQSQLPFFIITWSKLTTGYIFKELEKVVFPNFQDTALKSLLREFVQARVNNYGKRSQNTIYKDICKTCISEELVLENGEVKVKVNNSPLFFENKTFPMLYYKQKFIETSDINTLVDRLKNSFL